MINSKDYLTKNVTTATPSSPVAEIKKMIEADVNNGKTEFISDGKICLRAETQQLLCQSDVFATIEVHYWLLEHGWTLARATDAQLRLALFPVPVINQKESIFSRILRFLRSFWFCAK